MAINFPSSPAVGDTVSAFGKTWEYNGTGWSLQVADGGAVTSVNGQTGDVELDAAGMGAADIAFSKDFISGLALKWNSASSITVSRGAAYIEGEGSILRSDSDLTLSSLSLSASTLYYAYLYDNAGTPAIELVTTVPATPYSGTARSKTGDSSRRFLGAVLTDGSGNVISFSHAWQQGRVDYRTAVAGAPFRVLGNGRSTTGAIISMAAVTPVGASHAVVFLFNDASTAQTVLISASDGATVSTGDYEGFVAAGAQLSGALRMDGNRAMSYAYQATPSGAAGFTVRVTGYLFGR